MKHLTITMVIAALFLDIHDAQAAQTKAKKVSINRKVQADLLQALLLAVEQQSLKEVAMLLTAEPDLRSQAGQSVLEKAKKNAHLTLGTENEAICAQILQTLSHASDTPHCHKYK